MYARRTVLKTAAGTAVGLPLATVLADPLIARAVAQTTDTVSLTLPSGREVSAALALPQTTPAPAILLIHEWWGLNDQIKSVAAEYANQGYVALAVDLMGGEVATTPDQARALTGAVVEAEAVETLVGWIDWLKGHEATTGRVGTVGWCFGGGWSIRASMETPVDATVVYYGRVPGDPQALESLESPVMGHFGTEDSFINEEMVSTWAAAMNEAGKSYTVHWYDADHAFANPTGNAYDSEDAQLAWQRTLAFFDRYLTPEEA